MCCDFGVGVTHAHFKETTADSSLAVLFRVHREIHNHIVRGPFQLIDKITIVQLVAVDHMVQGHIVSS